MTPVEQAVQELATEVEEQNTVTASVLAFIDGALNEIEENKDEPEKITQIVTALRANRQSIAAKVTANTPTEPGQ